MPRVHDTTLGATMTDTTAKLARVRTLAQQALHEFFTTDDAFARIAVHERLIEIRDTIDRQEDPMPRLTTCHTCGGSGTVVIALPSGYKGTQQCSDCGGAGVR